MKDLSVLTSLQRKSTMSFDLRAEPQDSDFESLLQAREHIELQELGLLQAPERLLQALQKYPDGWPQPQRVRWSDSKVYDPQSAAMEELSPQELAQWERSWEQLQIASEQAASQCQSLATAQIPQIAALVAAHPQNPVLKNQLSQAYKLAGQTEAYRELVESMLLTHPQYLFSRLALAELALDSGQMDRFPEIFDGRYEIGEHASVPGQIFHCSAVASFYGLMGHFHLAHGRLLRSAWAWSLVYHAFGSHASLPPLTQALLDLPEPAKAQFRQWLCAPSKLKQRKRLKR